MNRGKDGEGVDAGDDGEEMETDVWQKLIKKEKKGKTETSKRRKYEKGDFF